MKKILLSAAILAGMFMVTNAQRGNKVDKPNQSNQAHPNTSQTKPRIDKTVVDKPGRVEVSLKDKAIRGPRKQMHAIHQTENGTDRTSPPVKQGSTKPIDRKGKLNTPPKKK